MGLTEYKKKRSFDKTPEPAGAPKGGDSELRFVIQKHHASRLHYDFRLELKGVLKSWAVPKGPSLNPDEKRLAMMVEDHPYDYRSFEGIIPKGNYGAGTVIVWDEGTYEPLEPLGKTKKEYEKQLLAALEKGDLKINLKGKKIKGAYALVHTKRPGQENAWLLIKKKDKFASDTDVTSKDKSVLSGLTLEKVAETSSNTWKSNRTSNQGKEKKDVKKKSQKLNEARDLKGAVKKAFPRDITPMLATLTDGAFDDEDWIFEIKWDGYRALAMLEKTQVELKSRNNISFSTKFHPITLALQELGLNAVLDGEIVAVNEDGRPDFQLLQAWQKTGKGQLFYYVFDILWLDGMSTLSMDIVKRKELLKDLLPENDLVKYSDHIAGSGKSFYELAADQGLEGIMAKHKESTYLAGKRSKQWLKIKTIKRQEAVIAGMTKGRGSRKHFGALVLGIYNAGKLEYIGHTGSGFDTQTLDDLYQKLEPIITEKSPFDKKPKTNMPVIWVEPTLVCEVKFQEWTRDGAMRIPIFIGLREDKDPKKVSRERSVPVEKLVADYEEDATEVQPARSQKLSEGKKLKVRKKPATKKLAVKNKSNLIPVSTQFDPNEKQKEVEINGKKLVFTNLGKLYWKKEKITKAALLNYYSEVMEYIFPYMDQRPQSLNRHPDGVDGKSFYQKNVRGKVADWIDTYDYRSESDGELKKFLVCANPETLMYIANLGCIELNPWHSRVSSADNPDWCVIDLDPGEISFNKVIEAALVVKKVLDALELPSWCKTSGSTGLHIYIPLGAKYSYDQSRQLAELIVTFVHDEIPGFTSLERSPLKRKTKIYLDYLQNRAIQTIAAPYSLRPKPGATVSTPLHWEEVQRGLKIADFNIYNTFARLRNEGDLFKGVLGDGIDLAMAIEKAGRL